jgi:hypothetical protein
MVFGDVITEKPRRIVLSQQFQPTLVKAFETVASALDVVKDPEFNLVHKGLIKFAIPERSESMVRVAAVLFVALPGEGSSRTTPAVKSGLVTHG